MDVAATTPAAGCQLAPLSSDTSTPAMTPPLSVAVPWIWYGVPTTGAGPAVMLVVGLTMSVVAEAAARAVIWVRGWMRMSANRFTVACCMLRSSVLAGPSCTALSPKAHWTVPAPKTRAPLGAR